MLTAEPVFLNEDPAQGMVGWRFGATDLPELRGTDKQVAWATDIRRISIEHFMEFLWREGGASALYSRHWWDDDLERDVERALAEVNRHVWPAISAATSAPVWINALEWGNRKDDPGIVIRIMRGETYG